MSACSTFKDLRNILALSAAFLVVFTGWHGSETLQTSLNREEDFGVLALSLNYGVAVPSALVSPIIIQKVGLKRVLLLGFFTHALFHAVNFYRSTYTVVAVTILKGISVNPVWSAQAYLTTTYAIDLADQRGLVRSDETVSSFHGIFGLLYKSSFVWGNLISWAVLKNKSPNVYPGPNNTNALNDPDVGTDVMMTTPSCGVWSCPIPQGNGSLATPSGDHTGYVPDHLRYVLMGVYLSLALGGMVFTGIAVTDPGLYRHGNQKLIGPKDMLLSTLSLLKTVELALLAPLMAFCGMQQAFLIGDVTKAFVACELGIEWVGYTMMCYGVTSAISPWVFGHLHKWIGFPINYTAAGIINMALFIQMLVYPVSKEHLGYFFFIPGIWGVLNGMWQSRTLALLGIHFSHNQRPAFANYHLWQGVGFTVSFAYGNLLCVATKIYICMTMLVLSLLLYYVVEIKTRIEKKKQLAEEGTADEKTNGEIPEAEKLAPNGISEDGAKKLALSTVSLPNVLTIPFKQSDLYLYANDVNFLAASTGSMIARWDSMSRDQFHSAVKARSKDSIHA